MIQAIPEPLLAAPPVETPARALRPESPSLWIWVPYLWLFLASSRSLSAWLDIFGQGGTVPDPDLSGNPVDSAVLTLLIVLGLSVLVLRAKRTGKLLAGNKWLVALFIYMALSIFWSNFPSISLRRCIRSTGTLVMVLVVLTEYNPLGAMRALLRRLYLLVIPLSVGAIKYFRSIGVKYDWNGVGENYMGITTDKNCLGQVAMCSGLFFTWQILQNWARRKMTLDLLLLVLTLWLLRGSKNSHSSTAIIGFLTSAAALFGLQYIRGKTARVKRVVLAFMIASVLLVPFAYLVFEMFNTTPVELILKSTHRDMTLTGRTGLWKDLFHNAEKNPVLGVGMGAFWVGHIGYSLYPLDNWSRVTPEWRPNEGHNGYLDVYVELGVVGVALLLIVIGVAFAGALNNLENQFELGSLRLVLLLGILTNNITETSFLKGTHALWFLFLLVVVNVPPGAQRVRSRSAARLQPLAPHGSNDVSGRVPDYALPGSVQNLSRRVQPRLT